MFLRLDDAGISWESFEGYAELQREKFRLYRAMLFLLKTDTWLDPPFSGELPAAKHHNWK